MRKLALLTGLAVMGALTVSCRPGNTPTAERNLNAELPSGESIMEKFIEAIGGREAHKKIKNTVGKGTFEIVGMGIKGDVTVYGAEPNLTLMEMDIPGMGKMSEGCDGKIAWSYSAAQGPSVKQGKELEEALIGAIFDETNWRAKYTGAETKGIETVEGEECYKVIVTPKAGNPRTQYFSRATGLLLRVDSVQESPMGTIAAETITKDYRKADGVLAPFQIIQKAAGMSVMITLSEIKNNTDMPRSTFDPPAAVKALLNK